MTSGTDSIFQAALSLPPNDRAVLAERLLDSLANNDQAEIDAAWVEEAERRIAAYEQGKLKAIPAEEVLRSILPRKKP